MTLDALLEEYQLNHPALGHDACNQYRIAIRQFTRYLGAEACVSDLTSEAIGGFMLSLRRSGDVMGRTINNKRSSLLTLSRFAVSRGMCERVPTTGKVREEQLIPNAFTLDELARILKAASLAPVLPVRPCHWHTQYWFPENWEILIRLIYETGHRLSALLACPRAAVNANGVLTMPAKLTKAGREIRHRLSPQLLELIEAQRPQTALLVPWPMSKKHIWPLLDKYILEPAGIPCDRRHKFHCLRRTSASHLLKACNDIRAASRHLGHADLKVTERYIDPAIAYNDFAACDILPRI